MKFAKYIMLAAFLAFLPTVIMAQRGSGGWCADNDYTRLFDVYKMVKFDATIVSVERFTPRKGMSYGLYLSVRTLDNEEVSVHLGPTWYLDNQEIQFAAGDRISVRGSHVIYNFNPVIIASVIEKEGAQLILRDKRGQPKWNAWRKVKQSQEINI
jgi:hypothetical protein